MSTLVLAVFAPLLILSGMAVWAFWLRYSIPSWRAGKLSIREHKLPIGISFIVLGLFGESVLYGTARISGSYVQISNILPVVLFLKCCYVIGLGFAVAWEIKVRTGVSRLEEVFCVVLALFSMAAMTLAVFG